MANGFRREPNWYLADGTYNRLSRAAIVTLAHLARCMDGKGWSGCLSTTRLIELTGLGKSSVARAVAELKDAGILDRENGEHRYTIHHDPRPTGGTDCPTDGTTGAPPVGHERPTGGTPAPHGWESLPYRSRTITKNTLQEGARLSIKQRQIDFEGNTYRIGEVATMITDRAKWPKGNIDPRAGLMIEGVLAAMHNGDMGDDAKADPIGTLGIAMRNHTRLQEKSGEADRFVGLLGNWLEKQYGNWVDARGMPFSEMGVSHVG
jgi:hypothetical protein